MKIKYKIKEYVTTSAKYQPLTTKTKLNAGDILLCIVWNGTYFTPGKEYPVVKLTKGSGIEDFQVATNQGEYYYIPAIIQEETKFVVKRNEN